VKYLGTYLAIINSKKREIGCAKSTRFDGMNCGVYFGVLLIRVG